MKAWPHFRVQNLDSDMGWATRVDLPAFGVWISPAAYAWTLSSLRAAQLKHRIFFFLEFGRKCSAARSCWIHKRWEKRYLAQLASTKTKGDPSHNQTGQQQKQDDPQIPQPDLRFVAKEANQQENGAGPKHKQPHWMPFHTAAFATVTTAKRCKIKRMQLNHLWTYQTHLNSCICTRQQDNIEHKHVVCSKLSTSLQSSTNCCDPVAAIASFQ